MTQAREVGADVLATSCPYCISNFEESRLGLEGEGGLEIKDVTEIVLEALDGSGGAAGDGTFSLDFSPFLDWEAGDLLRVWQWVTEYAAIVITEESPEMTVVQ